MIEVTLGEVLQADEALQKIASCELKVRAAYQVARLMREISSEGKLVFESRDKLIMKYGAKDEEGQLLVDENGNNNIPKENMEQFAKEYNEVLQTKITLNVEPIKLNDIENVELTYTDVVMLEPFITE